METEPTPYSDEECAFCGGPITRDGQWTAHWGREGTIVAFTCSESCTDSYMNGDPR